METLFNLVWLAVCISSLAAWRVQFKRAGGNASGVHPGLGVRRTQSLLLLIFVLALLFPVISITDDLQMDAALVEAKLSSQETAKVLAKAALEPAAAKLSHTWLLFVNLVAMALVVIWRFLEKVQVPLLSLRFALIPDRRPPPTILMVF